MSQSLSSFSAQDKAIRQAFAASNPHRPQIDISAAALTLAKQRRNVAVQRTNSIQRMNRLWQAIVAVTLLAIVVIITFALLRCFSITTQTTSTAATTTMQTAASITSTTPLIRVLEWSLMLAVSGTVWLIISGVWSAVSAENSFVIIT
jgi:hypothetical protein